MFSVKLTLLIKPPIPLSRQRRKKSAVQDVVIGHWDIPNCSTVTSVPVSVVALTTPVSLAPVATVLVAAVSNSRTYAEGSRNNRNPTIVIWLADVARQG